MNKIFISHAFNDTEDVKNKLRGFYEYLNKVLVNFNIILDLDYLTGGEEIPRFMSDSINECLCVICICTPSYLERASVSDSGVAYELDLIKTREANSTQSTFIVIPLFFDDIHEKELPKLLNSFKYKCLNRDFKTVKKDLYPDLFIPFSEFLNEKLTKNIISYHASFNTKKYVNRMKFINNTSMIEYISTPENFNLSLHIANKTDKHLNIKILGLIDNNRKKTSNFNPLANINLGIRKDIILNPNKNGAVGVFEYVLLNDISILKRFLEKKQTVKDDLNIDYDFDIVFELAGIKFNIPIYIGTPIQSELVLF